jgi:hypothetical protein
MDDAIDYGPATTVRRHDKGYPFGDRYPIAIRMKRSARSDTLCGIEIAQPPLLANAGAVYPAWTNSYGAVCAILADGKKLGLYPDEFDVVEWSA